MYRDRNDGKQFQSTLPTRGSDHPTTFQIFRKNRFNPRSPRGGATLLSRLWHSDNQSFNPRSPRGGATLDIIRKAVRHAVSIHAPHEGERRAISINYIFHIVCFNPRSPRGGATNPGRRLCRTMPVSIHAPHEGERLFLCDFAAIHKRFNPRSPRGGATFMHCRA